MIYETVRALAAEQLGCNEFRLTPSTVILEDLEAEPEDLVELMLALEQEFSFEWTEADLREIATLGDLTSFIENQM